MTALVSAHVAPRCELTHTLTKAHMPMDDFAITKTFTQRAVPLWIAEIILFKQRDFSITTVSDSKLTRSEQEF